ncbi:MAG: RHS repeat-associated core domain-containing protein, partial [Kiritimatiellia bacterium]|nr:RHS repeat-associated core domain-containing protein [Kiritimatiellia bacterium]
YYYGYRFYSPELGRWLNRDPIGEASDDNLYIFIANSVLNRRDYLGLFGEMHPNITNEEWGHILDGKNPSDVIGRPLTGLERGMLIRRKKLREQDEAVQREETRRDMHELTKRCLYMRLELEDLIRSEGRYLGIFPKTRQLVRTELKDGDRISRCSQIRGGVFCRNDPECASIAAEWQDRQKAYTASSVSMREDYRGLVMDATSSKIIVGPTYYEFSFSRIPSGYNPQGEKLMRPGWFYIHDKRQEIYGEDLTISLLINGEVDETVRLVVQ